MINREGGRERGRKNKEIERRKRKGVESKRE